MLRRNLLLLLGVIILVIAPLAFHSKTAKFSGSDDQASAMIRNLRPGYQRWMVPVWEPPSPEIESLLFALQAGLGAGLLGYYFGRRSGLAEAREAAQRLRDIDRAD
jgi:cobalt/nickel transport protein